MKTARWIAAALLVAAPGGAAWADAAAKSAPPQAFPAIQLDEAFLVGRWTDDGDCSDAVEFAADGTYETSGGSSGGWRLIGNALTISGGATLTVRVVPVNEDTILIVNAQGSAGRSTRCDAQDDQDEDGPPPLRIA